MPITLKDKSKTNYTAENDFYNPDHAKIGALQRIADATEAMAKNYNDLLRDVKLYKDMYRNQTERRQKLERSNAALRGQITKLRKNQNKKKPTT